VAGALFSDDPMAVFEACHALRHGDLHLSGVHVRLLDLLADDRDADCGELVCAAAAGALARLEPSGAWRVRAGRAFRSHIDNENHDQARALAAVVRRSVPAGEYLVWAWGALREKVARIGGRAAAAAEWLPEWETDGDLVEALLAVDEPSRQWVYRGLLIREAVLRHMIRAEPRSSAVAGWESDLASLSRWTRDAPPALREETDARARETGLA
jgi:hypothetical protein